MTGLLRLPQLHNYQIQLLSTLYKTDTFWTRTKGAFQKSELAVQNTGLFSKFFLKPLIAVHTIQEIDRSGWIVYSTSLWQPSKIAFRQVQFFIVVLFCLFTYCTPASCRQPQVPREVLRFTVFLVNGGILRTTGLVWPASADK